MPTLGFSHYNLRTPRPLLEQLRHFYCDVVGLTLGERPPFDSYGYWLYAGSQAVLHLSETRGPQPAGSGPVAPGPSAFDHAAFRCTGLAAFEQKLTQLGIRYATVRVPVTGETQLFLKDPAGNGIELNFAEG